MLLTCIYKHDIEHKFGYFSTSIPSDLRLAWGNVRSYTHSGMYDNLSDELKGSLELALVIARNCETLPLHFPPIELADNDELGSVLAARGEHYLLNGMSRRIKKRYMSEDELERWGSDPHWWSEVDDGEDGE